MKFGGKVEICAVVGLVLVASAKGIETKAADEPYQGIVERNVFNLHAPPPPINPEDLIKHTPPPKITFTGITTILGRKLAFLTIPAAKPGAPPDSMALAEGQAENDVEVKQIDDRAGIVKVINHGQPETLDFEHNGAKAAPAPAAVPHIGALPQPGAPPPNVIRPPGNVIRPLRTLPTRGTPFSENDNGAGGMGGPGAAGAGGSTPLTPEEQVALIEVQRVKYQDENNPVANLFPTTELTPQAPDQSQGGQGQAPGPAPY